MADASAIRIEGLTKRYGGRAVVDCLTLEVPTGSVFGLLGENGAGKTTTIQAMLGLVAPDAGRIDVLGLDAISRGLDIRRRVGYVPERPSLYEWMTVAEVGWFAAGFRPQAPGGVAGCQARFEGLVRGFGLPLDRRIRALSKGMRAEVGLALALAPEPELLILDEPTSGLDVLVRREFLESMVDLAGAGRTVLLSSHQISEVERVASHVALLHRGRLILAEPLDGLLARTFVLDVTADAEGRTPDPPSHPAIDLIDLDVAPRQSRWLVHASDPSALELVRSLPGVGEVRIERPSLEEIYIGTMRGRRGPADPAPEAAVATA